jgi:hypothetical protein
MIQSRLNPSTSTRILSLLGQQGMSSWQRASKVALISSMMCISRSMFIFVVVATILSTGHREDVITLQNPHGLPSASVPTTSTLVTQKDKVVATAKPAVAGPVSAVQKEAAPCPFHPSSLLLRLLISMAKGNISPYSSGAPGASLTSTSVDPQTVTSRLVWDEVCTDSTAVATCLTIPLGRNDV